VAGLSWAVAIDGNSAAAVSKAARMRKYDILISPVAATTACHRSFAELICSLCIAFGQNASIELGCSQNEIYATCCRKRAVPLVLWKAGRNHPVFEDQMPSYQPVEAVVRAFHVLETISALGEAG